MKKPHWRHYVPQWKEAHGTIFYVRIDSTDFVFRAPSYGEFLAFKEFVEVKEGDHHPPLLSYAEDHLIRKVLLYPKPFDLNDPELLCSTVAKLVSAIVKSSRFYADAFESVYNGLRNDKNNDPDYAIILLICRAYPGLQPDEVRGWQQEKILRYLVMAEDILGWDLKTGLRTPENEPSTVNTVSYNAGEPVKKKKPQRITSPMSMPDPMQGGKIDTEAESRAIGDFLRG